MSGLTDKVVDVTGATEGTGRVHCARFADEARYFTAATPPVDAGVTRR